MNNKDSTQLEKLEENLPYICSECGEFSSRKPLFCENVKVKIPSGKPIRMIILIIFQKVQKSIQIIKELRVKTT